MHKTQRNGIGAVAKFLAYFGDNVFKVPKSEVDTLNMRIPSQGNTYRAFMSSGDLYFARDP